MQEGAGFESYELGVMSGARNDGGSRHFDPFGCAQGRLCARGTSARSGEIPCPTQCVLEGLRVIAGDSSTTLRSARNAGGVVRVVRVVNVVRVVKVACRQPQIRKNSMKYNSLEIYAHCRPP